MKLVYTGKIVLNKGSDAVTTQGRLALCNNNEDEFSQMETDLVAHDIEHLLFGLGHSLLEETFIDRFSENFNSLSERHPLFNLREWEDMFYLRQTEFFLCSIAKLHTKFKLVASLDNRKVTVDITYL